jgi:hypothetical protein
MSFLFFSFCLPVACSAAKESRLAIISSCVAFAEIPKSTAILERVAARSASFCCIAVVCSNSFAFS